MGDGSLVRMTPAEIAADVHDGVAVAVRRARVEPVSDREVQHLVDIFCSSARFTVVDIGAEVVLTFDGGGSQDMGTRVHDLQYYDKTVRRLVELYHQDYSYKAVKTVLPYEQIIMRQAQLLVTVPCGYGAMPDLGRYTAPDWPLPNWSQLLPAGRIEEARAAQEEAAEMAAADIVVVAEGMIEVGADSIDLDTAGAAWRRRFPGRPQGRGAHRREVPRCGSPDRHGG